MPEKRWDVRFIDRLLGGMPIQFAEDALGRGRRYGQDSTERFLSQLRQSPMFVMDNVSDYFYYGNDKEQWDYRGDFPNIAPPYQSFWMESIAPKEIHGAYGVIRWDRRRMPLCGGVLVWAPELPEGGWKMYLTAVLQFADLPFAVVYPPVVVPVDADGSWGKGEKGSTYAVCWPEPELDEVGDQLGTEAQRVLLPYYFGLSLLNCKNVERVENRPPKKMSQARQKRGKPPLVRYTTLDIHPMREVLRREGGSETNGLKKALHLCRGHFKRYEGKGLFGKYSGTFWWDAHARGDAAGGRVEKRYNVVCPSSPGDS